MEKILGLSILSFALTGLLLVPFIDFLYKLKFQRQTQKTRDMFNKRTLIFDKFSEWKVGTPVGGGLLIIFVVTILTLWSYPVFRVDANFWEVFVIFFGLIGFGVLGLIDDLKKISNNEKNPFFGLRFKYKFAIQWILALIIGYIFYKELNGNFIYIHWFQKVEIGWLFIPFAAFVIVSFANASNITDGLDGLATGALLICLIAFLTISHSTNTLHESLGVFIAILMGAIAAFLYFNIYKARLWLGDVGSLSLGAVLGIVGLLTGKTVALAFIGGVFVLEIGSSLLQILSKRFRGKRLFPVAPLHLWLLERGWEEPKIVMRAWLLGFIFAILGLYIAFAG